MKEEDKYKTFMYKKRYLLMNRLFSALMGMFIFIITIVMWFKSYLAGVIFTATVGGILSYMLLDLMADKYEDRLIDFEEFYGIKKPADKRAYKELTKKRK